MNEKDIENENKEIITNNNSPEDKVEGEEKIETKKNPKDLLNDAAEILETVITFLLIFLLFRAYVIDHAVVNGESMYPNLRNEDKLLYSKIYSPENGDIVIVKNELLGPIIKRVIATEGQEIDIKDGCVYVDGEMLDEQIYVEGQALTAEYFVSSATSVGSSAFIPATEYPVEVPENCVFVLGDNRHKSNDSRSSDVGFVDKSDILGEAFFRYYPSENRGFLK